MVEATKRLEKAAVLELLLIALLIAGAALLYWGPMAAGELAPRWWHWVALGVLFFAILALHTWRARHRSHRALHEAIREDAAIGSARTEQPQGPGGSESDSPEPRSS